jgi:hypothetical protein
VETFAPVARYTYIGVVMSLVSFMRWRIHQIDVKTTFLNGIIEEEVYTRIIQNTWNITSLPTFTRQRTGSLRDLR